MKTKEFIKRVEELGYLLSSSYYCWEIRNKKNYLIAVVSKDVLYKISTDSAYWDGISDEDKNKLLGLLIEYAKTPIKDREEEKKYYLKHRYLQSSFTNLNDFLSYSASDNKLALSNGINFPKYKTHFTLKEIEEIKEKFDTDLSDYELIKVKDEKV